MDEAKWEEQATKTVRFMVNSIWDGINQSDTDRFLGNFNDNKKVGLALLNMLIYYSEEQEASIVDNLLRLLWHDFWIKGFLGEYDNSSNEIYATLDKMNEKICFIPVNDKDDPSSSSYSLSPLYKKSKSMPKAITFAEPKDIPLMMAMHKEYFIIYDDVIGTGNQFSTFWNSTKHFGKYNFTLNMFAACNPSIKFYYLVLGGCRKSIDKLQEEYPNITILVSEVFTDDCSVTSENNEYWEFNPSIKQEVINYVVSKKHELNAESSFSLDLPLLFQHCRAPNTALSLYWYHKEGKWNQLYGR